MKENARTDPLSEMEWNGIEGHVKNVVQYCYKSLCMLFKHLNSFLSYKEPPSESHSTLSMKFPVRIIFFLIPFGSFRHSSNKTNDNRRLMEEDGASVHVT